MQALEWLALAVAIQYHGAGPALVSKITGCGGQQWPRWRRGGC